MQGTKQWNDFNTLKKNKNCQFRILYPVETSFKNEGIMTFSDKKKKKDVFVTSKLLLQEH